MKDNRLSFITDTDTAASIEQTSKANGCQRFRLFSISVL